MRKIQKIILAVAAGVTGLCSIAQAAFVTIGDAGNTADTNGFGAVGYTYQISTTEVTIDEFVASGAGDGDEAYWNTSSRTVGLDAPASRVILYEAMKYANWLTSGNINSGYYTTTDGGATWQANALSHDAYAAANGTTYFVPTEDEWYKAAYYTGNSFKLWSLYANGSRTPPLTHTDANYSNNLEPWAVGTGTEEQHGTYDMMGNVWEWVETSIVRGGAYYSTLSDLKSSSPHLAISPTLENPVIGFRIVAIPEPATCLLLAIGGGVAWLMRLKQRL